MKIPAPNYTQTPNILFDEVMKTLKEGELRVLLVITRQTFGWRKRWDRISLSQLIEKTGMCRDAVINSLKSLVEKKIILKHQEGPNGTQKTWYTLSVEEVEEEPEIPDEFNEDSNNSYQSSKTTPPSRFRRPTKETITKEILSPIVPTGDPPPRKSKHEQKKQVALEVFVTQKQEDILLDKLKGNQEMLKAVYEKLSNWKIGKGISGGKNDYKSLVDWCIGQVVEDFSLGKRPGVSRMEEDKKLAEQVKEKFKIDRNIEIGYNYLTFHFGPTRCDEIKFGESGFKERIMNNLRKMGLNL